MIVIYDPNAGFVTGGGYITHTGSMTPAGTGRQGQLRIRRQVQEGRLAPRRRDRVPVQGLQHQLPLDVARLAHREEHHQWPERRRPEGVVPGFGTINGTGDYRFQVTLIDKGNTDYFRIKIWNATTGVPLRQHAGQVDGIDPSIVPANTLISGGNLVIHK